MKSGQIFSSVKQIEGVRFRREAQYSERCIAAQGQNLWGFARISGPVMHPTDVGDYCLTNRVPHLDRAGIAHPTF